MSKETAETKSEKQAEALKPTAITDEEIEEVRGGHDAPTGGTCATSVSPSEPLERKLNLRTGVIGYDCGVRQ